MELSIFTPHFQPLDSVTSADVCVCAESHHVKNVCRMTQILLAKVVQTLAGFQVSLRIAEVPSSSNRRSTLSRQGPDELGLRCNTSPPVTCSPAACHRVGCEIAIFHSALRCCVTDIMRGSEAAELEGGGGGKACSRTQPHQHLDSRE
ncbi:uncharacterized [Tachysurus ichikawai]